MNVTIIARRTAIAAGLAIAGFGLSTGTASAGDFDGDYDVDGHDFVTVPTSPSTRIIGDVLLEQIPAVTAVDGTSGSVDTDGPMPQTREHVLLASCGDDGTACSNTTGSGVVEVLDLPTDLTLDLAPTGTAAGSDNTYRGTTWVW